MQSNSFDKNNSLPLQAKETKLLKEPLRWSTGASPNPPHGQKKRKDPTGVNTNLLYAGSGNSSPQPKAKSLESLLDKDREASQGSMDMMLHPSSIRSNGVAHRANSVPPPSEQELSSTEPSDETNTGSLENFMRRDGTNSPAGARKSALSEPRPQSSPVLPVRICSQIEDDNEQPLAPPRTASLPANRQVKGNGRGSGNGGMIHVSEYNPAALSPPKRRIHAYEEVNFLEPPSKQEGMYDHLPAAGEEESEYDHLFPTKKGHKNAVRSKDGRLKAKKSNSTGEHLEVHAHHSPVRRNESMPKLTSNGKPRIEISPTGRGDLSDSDQERDLSPSPLASPSSPGVVFRHRSPDRRSDPFEELLKAPTAKSNLRWSQELNPLYDYVRGGKVSPLCGYEIPSPLSTKAIKKTHSPIEEEGPLEDGADGGKRHSSQSEQCPQDYEEAVTSPGREKSGSIGSRPRSQVYQEIDDTGDKEVQSATISAPFRRVKTDYAPHFASPRLGKRALPNQRINRTVTCVDDSNAPQHRQRPHYAGDTMKVSNTTCSGYNPLLS